MRVTHERAAHALAHPMSEVPALRLVYADHRRGSVPYPPGKPRLRGRSVDC
jgi:hypothetical protein